MTKRTLLVIAALTVILAMVSLFGFDKKPIRGYMPTASHAAHVAAGHPTPNPIRAY